MDNGKPKFELEPLEPRLLLSGNGIVDEAVALTDLTALPSTVVHEYQTSDEITLAAVNTTSYNPESQLSSIFDVSKSSTDSQEQEFEADALRGGLPDKGDQPVVPTEDFSSDGDKDISGENIDGGVEEESINTDITLSNAAPVLEYSGSNITDVLVETLTAPHPPPDGSVETLNFQADSAGMALQASEPPAWGTPADLTLLELTPVIEEAKARWIESGLLDQGEIDLLDGVSFEILDLDDLALGFTSGSVIQIDINAAGHGWFVDATPLDDSEYELEIYGQLITADENSCFVSHKIP